MSAAAAGKLMIPKLCKGCVLFVLLSLLTGCWSRIEVNDRAFVTMVFVDAVGEDQMDVGIGFPLPNRMVQGKTGSTQEKGRPFTALHQHAESIGIAIQQIQSNMTRDITWGHIRVLILGEEMAKRGIHSIMEYATRLPNFQTKTYVIVVKGTAMDLALGLVNPVMERFPSEILRELLARTTAIDTTVKDIVMADAYGGDGMTALFRMEKQQSSAEDEPINWLRNAGAAIFKDGKMVGDFNVQEMRAALWIKGKMEDAVISIDSPTDGKTISFQIMRSNAKIKTKVNGDSITFRIQVEANDDILESDSTINLQDIAVVEQLQQLLSQDLKERLEHALKKSQQMGVDAFGLGHFLAWNYPKQWKKWKLNWDDIYREQVSFEVDAKVNVKRPGGILKPYWIHEDH
jgi:spore germination protein KC